MVCCGPLEVVWKSKYIHIGIYYIYKMILVSILWCTCGSVLGDITFHEFISSILQNFTKMIAVLVKGASCHYHIIHFTSWPIGALRISHRAGTSAMQAPNRATFYEKTHQQKCHPRMNYNNKSDSDWSCTMIGSLRTLYIELYLCVSKFCIYTQLANKSK